MYTLRVDNYTELNFTTSEKISNSRYKLLANFDFQVISIHFHWKLHTQAYVGRPTLNIRYSNFANLPLVRLAIFNSNEIFLTVDTSKDPKRCLVLLTLCYWSYLLYYGAPICCSQWKKARSASGVNCSFGKNNSRTSAVHQSKFPNPTPYWGSNTEPLIDSPVVLSRTVWATPTNLC